MNCPYWISSPPETDRLGFQDIFFSDLLGRKQLSATGFLDRLELVGHQVVALSVNELLFDDQLNIHIQFERICVTIGEHSKESNPFGKLN